MLLVSFLLCNHVFVVNAMCDIHMDYSALQQENFTSLSGKNKITDLKKSVFAMLEVEDKEFDATVTNGLGHFKSVSTFIKNIDNIKTDSFVLDNLYNTSMAMLQDFIDICKENKQLLSPATVLKLREHFNI